MPEPDCFLRYRISHATRNFTSGKSDVYVLLAAARRGFKMVLRPTELGDSDHLGANFIELRSHSCEAKNVDSGTGQTSGQRDIVKTL